MLALSARFSSVSLSARSSSMCAMRAPQQTLRSTLAPSLQHTRTNFTRVHNNATQLPITQAAGITNIRRRLRRVKRKGVESGEEKNKNRQMVIESSKVKVEGIKQQIGLAESEFQTETVPELKQQLLLHISEKKKKVDAMEKVIRETQGRMEETARVVAKLKKKPAY